MEVNDGIVQCGVSGGEERMNFIDDSIFQTALNTLDRLNDKSEGWQLEISATEFSFVRRDRNGDDWEVISSGSKNVMDLATLCYKIFKEKLT